MIDGFGWEVVENAYQGNRIPIQYLIQQSKVFLFVSFEIVIVDESGLLGD